MNTEITMVRIYCTEAEHKYDKLMQRLHDQEKVAGVTAYRGIAGFGRSGKIHTASLLDVSLDLPIIIEFFDRPARAARVMADLESLVEPGHMVSWQATVNLPESDPQD